MPAILVSILKWLFVTVIVPMITKWIEARTKVQKRVAKYKAKKSEAIKKAEEFEKNPTDDNRNSLP